MGVDNKLLREAEYTVAMAYDASNNPIYVGEASPGTSQSSTGWRIKQITFDGSNATDVKWASSSTAFDKKWDDRTTYSYG